VSLTPAYGYPPTHIQISSIGVDAQVVPIGWQVETIGDVEHPVWTVPEAHLAGWHENTVSLGVPGNTVINGHNWPENAVFRNLYQVQVGDTITLYSGDKEFFYQVTESLLLPEAGQPLEVRQANAQYIQPTLDERVTLVTCHPYGRTTFRLIVIARPVSSPGGE
jgi:sortase A